MNARKTRWAGLLALLMTGGASGAWAASDSIVLLVTPTCAEAIVVSAAPEPYNFGNLEFSVSTHSTRSISVSNTGSCTDTWGLSVADSGADPWAAASSAGLDAYVLRAAFTTSTTQPATSTFDADDVVVAAATACTASKYDGDTSCLDVAPAGARNLWFKLDMPTGSNDSTPNEHTLTVSVTTTP